MVCELRLNRAVTRTVSVHLPHDPALGQHGVPLSWAEGHPGRGDGLPGPGRGPSSIPETPAGAGARLGDCCVGGRDTALGDRGAGHCGSPGTGRHALASGAGGRVGRPGSSLPGAAGTWAGSMSLQELVETQSPAPPPAASAQDGSDGTGPGKPQPERRVPSERDRGLLLTGAPPKGRGESPRGSPRACLGLSRVTQGTAAEVRPQPLSCKPTWPRGGEALRQGEVTLRWPGARNPGQRTATRGEKA